jgi:Fe-S cluster biogenesis protein NfuA
MERGLNRRLRSCMKHGYDPPFTMQSASNIPLQQVAARSLGPAPTFLEAGSTLEKVERVIKLIRPAVQADGGDLELLGMTQEGDVHIRLHGACVGCPSSSVTLQVGIERNLRAHIPEVKRVVAS